MHHHLARGSGTAAPYTTYLGVVEDPGFGWIWFEAQHSLTFAEFEFRTTPRRNHISIS